MRRDAAKCAADLGVRSTALVAADWHDGQIRVERVKSENGWRWDNLLPFSHKERGKEYAPGTTAHSIHTNHILEKTFSLRPERSTHLPF
jgi:hypothetical protein